MKSSIDYSTFGDLITAHITAFVSAHDEYSLSISESHRAPSKYSGGQRTLTVTVTCPTGEPPVRDDES